MKDSASHLRETQRDIEKSFSYPQFLLSTLFFLHEQVSDLALFFLAENL